MGESGHGESEAEPRVLRGIRLALLLGFVILGVEAVGAFLSHSLSLTVDAVHNLPDLFAFGVSWTALKATERGASGSYSFGTHRIEVFAGLLNGGLVLGVGAAFALEALATLHSGVPFAGAVDPLWILLAALPTLALRAASLVALERLPRRARDLNLSSVIVHVASDILITGTLLTEGLLLVVRPSYGWIDPAAAVAIGAILVYESLPLFRVGWGVLAEQVPPHLDVGAVTAAILSDPEVSEVHDVHIWAVCPTLVCMTAHLRVGGTTLREATDTVGRTRHRMEEDFGILHCVFEVEAGLPG